MDEKNFAELRRLELRLMDPAVRHDRANVASLLADDFVEFGASGRVWTRDSILELLATERFDAPVIEDFRCRMLGEHVALVTYRAVRMKPEGERAATLRSSLWMRKSGNWQMYFHQGTKCSE
ncbi:DUF4440 domain-containing protein [Telmatobacter sp. DSM 110680]|uniref:DUF4440 domain-containing protein n=1 Tax=Telmatobacter sp. DSM 110680 TaxID=3036704 RepID=A0AAU7DNF6_9BACT